jgi:hypothetical protein
MIRYGSGSRKLTGKKIVAVAARPQVSVSLFGQRLDVYENTHLELLMALEWVTKRPEGVKSLSLTNFFQSGG